MVVRARDHSGVVLNGVSLLEQIYSGQPQSNKIFGRLIIRDQCLPIRHCQMVHRLFSANDTGRVLYGE